MSDETIKQNAFYLTFEHSTPNSNQAMDEFHSMRDWQKEAFQLLKDQPFMVLNAPTGSGKSWLMCLLSAHKMKVLGTLRTIIAVPQTIIANGFVTAKFRLPDGEYLYWNVNHNLCAKGANQGTTAQYVIQWLQQNHQSFNDRALICTHATLVKTYQQLEQEGLLHLLTDLLFWIDEAHHVSNNNATIENIAEDVSSNKIGELVKYLLNQTEKQNQLGLTTATYYRGDRRTLLTQSMQIKFSRFNLPLDKHLKSMEYLKSFSFDFLLCGSDYSKAIGSLARERQGKDIIYIPHPTSRHSSGNKRQEVQNIVIEYQKIHGDKLLTRSDGLNVLQGPKNDFKILDLVSENQRAEKKNFLIVTT